MDRQGVKKSLIEIGAKCKHLARWPQALKDSDIRELEGHIQLLRYHVLADYTPAKLKSLQIIPEYLRCVECEALGLASTTTLYLVRQRWVCVKHIPADVIFPVGLWGQEWIESGRAASGPEGRLPAEAKPAKAD